MQAHRNLQWLYWFSGEISHVPMNGVDVLTGPMSGCILVMFRHNGVVHAGHLGTDIAHPDNNAAVKDTWNTFATDNEDDVVGGFNPANDWPGGYPAQRRGEGAARIFGLMTTAQEFWTIFTYQQHNNNNLLRIAGRQRIASKSKDQLKHV